MTEAAPRCRVCVATAANPGAIAIVQLVGPGARDTLTALTGRTDWPAGAMRLANLAGLDEGLAVLLRDDWAQLFPHGGVRVVQRMVDAAVAHGAVADVELNPRELYPEATSALEADMLAAIARAASPRAVDLLLVQPELWRDALGDAALCSEEHRAAMLERSGVLDRLVDPPSVAVVGRPNVGKSTLTNRVLGRSASVVADLPGTTRDWVAGLAEVRGVAVRWLDTPGLRDSDDEIERRAIALSHAAIDAADLWLVLRDAAADWPDLPSHARRPAVYAVNKVDDGRKLGDGVTPGSPLALSAATGAGTSALEHALLDGLGLGRLGVELWAFSPTLRRALASGDAARLRKYLHPDNAA